MPGSNGKRQKTRSKIRTMTMMKMKKEERKKKITLVYERLTGIQKTEELYNPILPYHPPPP